MNNMLTTPEAEQAQKQAPSIDALLQQKRASLKQVRPSDGFWDNTFAPRFARKMMVALGRPRHTGRTLTIVGWTTPFVVTALFALAMGVAYFFSPQRAIARWEAEATRKDYVVDNLKNGAEAGKTYQIDAGKNELTSQGSSTAGTLQLTVATDVPESRSQF